MNKTNILVATAALENNTTKRLNFSLRFITEPKANGCGEVDWAV